VKLRKVVDGGVVVVVRDGGVKAKKTKGDESDRQGEERVALEVPTLKRGAWDDGVRSSLRLILVVKDLLELACTLTGWLAIAAAFATPIAVRPRSCLRSMCDILWLLTVSASS